MTGMTLILFFVFLHMDNYRLGGALTFCPPPPIEWNALGGGGGLFNDALGLVGAKSQRPIPVSAPAHVYISLSCSLPQAKS